MYWSKYISVVKYIVCHLKIRFSHKILKNDETYLAKHLKSYEIQCALKHWKTWEWRARPHLYINILFTVGHTKFYWAYVFNCFVSPLFKKLKKLQRFCMVWRIIQYYQKIASKLQYSTITNSKSIFLHFKIDMFEYDFTVNLCWTSHLYSYVW